MVQGTHHNDGDIRLLMTEQVLGNLSATFGEPAPLREVGMGGRGGSWALVPRASRRVALPVTLGLHMTGAKRTGSTGGLPK